MARPLGTSSQCQSATAPRSHLAELHQTEMDGPTPAQRVTRWRGGPYRLRVRSPGRCGAGAAHVGSARGQPHAALLCFVARRPAVAFRQANDQTTVCARAPGSSLPNPKAFSITHYSSDPAIISPAGSCRDPSQIGMGMGRRRDTLRYMTEAYVFSVQCIRSCLDLFFFVFI